MASFRDEIFLAAPPEEVFAWTSDVMVMADVQDNILAVRPPDREIVQGSRFPATLSIFGRTHEVEAEMTRLEPPTSVGVRTQIVMAPGLTLHVAMGMDIEPREVGSRLVATGDFTFSIGFARLAENALVALGRRNLRDTLARLGELIENGPPRTAARGSR